jgi:predicted RNA-binding Zn-ribbon protein involved in translation (DUF1610 family)
VTPDQLASLIALANAGGAYFKCPELKSLGYRRCAECRVWVMFEASVNQRRCPPCNRAHIKRWAQTERGRAIVAALNRRNYLKRLARDADGMRGVA